MKKLLVCLWSLLSVVGCLDAKPAITLEEALGCSMSTDCPQGYRCVAGACVDSSLCGDGVIQSGERCDDGDANSDAYSFAEHCNSTCSGSASGGYCGDGFVNAAYETCDDGNDATNDACPSGPQGPCQVAFCGDGFIWNQDGGTEICEPSVTPTLSCSDVDGAELGGTTQCSEIYCTFGLAACFESPEGFVRIVAGTFMMGSPATELGRDGDEVLHQVTLTRGFHMMEHEVTQAQWEALMGNNPSQNNNGSCPQCPVDYVNWWEALHYANALSETEGLTACYVMDGCDTDDAGEGRECTRVTLQGGDGAAIESPYDCVGYRLPTEAEWEYAYRAGTTTAFYNGDITSTTDEDPKLGQIAWYIENSNATTHPVKGKLPNAWGLYDMAGNVWEWNWDWYERERGAEPVTDPHGPLSGEFRLFRGGSWDSLARNSRAAYRYSNIPGERVIYRGFRLVRTIEPRE